ncbi:unnamed protein product [Paramecium octaurelia]|uniref:Uncharacterized protein n=1 Tax=Paramecium octaurelia TaxID=43137 RepID=A0A8S1VYZ1_PAROT|nr:unnamed protein product [Paramecium octaurelia]
MEAEELLFIYLKYDFITLQYDLFVAEGKFIIVKSYHLYDSSSSLILFKLLECEIMLIILMHKSHFLIIIQFEIYQRSS